VGSFTWYFCLAYAGMKLGEKWHTDPRFYEWFHRFHLVVEIAPAGCGVVCVVAPEPRKRSTRALEGEDLDGNRLKGVHCFVCRITKWIVLRRKQSKEG
jgi:hypothetical protein